MITIPQVAAYLDAVTLKNVKEENAEIFQSTCILALVGNGIKTQPWPREFDYNLEFFAGDSPPVNVGESVRAYLRDGYREHTIQIFSNKLHQLIPFYRSLGYQHAWSNFLMEKKLQRKDIQPLAPGIKIVPIESAEDVDLANRIEPDYPCVNGSLNDPAIYNLIAFYSDQVCAKGQMIITEKKYAVVMDIFTHPNFRRKGISTALMHTFHHKALNLGCKTSLLMPSRMTREIDIFQKLNYQNLIEAALFVPDRPE